jgi:hypothetical protein
MAGVDLGPEMRKGEADVEISRGYITYIGGYRQQDVCIQSRKIKTFRRREPLSVRSQFSRGHLVPERLFITAKLRKHRGFRKRAAPFSDKWERRHLWTQGAIVNLERCDGANTADSEP